MPGARGGAPRARRRTGRTTARTQSNYAPKPRASSKKLSATAKEWFPPGSGKPQRTDSVASTFCSYAAKAKAAVVAEEEASCHGTSSGGAVMKGWLILSVTERQNNLSHAGFTARRAVPSLATKVPKVPIVHCHPTIVLLTAEQVRKCREKYLKFDAQRRAEQQRREEESRLMSAEDKLPSPLEQRILQNVPRRACEDYADYDSSASSSSSSLCYGDVYAPTPLPDEIGAAALERLGNLEWWPCVMDEGCHKDLFQLLEMGADWDARLPDEKMNALHIVAARKDVVALEILLRFAGQPGACSRDRRSLTPLHYSAIAGCSQCTKLCLSEGGRGNAKTSRGESALHLAVQNGHTGVVDILCSSKVDVNCRNKRRQTPLHIAVKMGDLASMESLLRAGARIDAANDEGICPLCWAAMHNSTDTLELMALPQHRFLCDLSFFRRPLDLSSAPNRSSSTSCRKGMGTRRKCLAPQILCPLAEAAGAGFERCVQLLLEMGFDPNEGRTPPLTRALQGTPSPGRLACCNILLSLGCASPSVADERGECPLVTATRAKYLEALLLLLRHGADPNKTFTKIGPAAFITPLEIAIRSSWYDGIAALMEGGAAITPRCAQLFDEPHGHQPAHDGVSLKLMAEHTLLTALKGSEQIHPETLLTLFEVGQMINAQSLARQTAMHILLRFSEVACQITTTSSAFVQNLLTVLTRRSHTICTYF
jgi:ankyrin repeat protein